MDNDHGITGELREWIEGRVFLGNGWQELLRIADRIDAEYERTMAAAAFIAGVPMTDENMAEHGWVKLPKDADGVPIRIGDKVEWIRYKDDDPTIVRTVSAVGVGVFFAWSDEQGRYAQYEARAYRHHKQPTVEDVLRGVITLCYNTWKEESPFHFCDVDDVMKSGNIAEYAAKLRLAGDEQ